MEKLIIVIAIIIVAVILFFVFRNLILWYFKIDEHLENQRKIIELLGKINCLLNTNKND